MGKGDTRRRKTPKAKTKTIPAPQRPLNGRKHARATILAPTPQQEGKGVYTRAKGPGRTEAVVNLTPDMIGRLLHERKITPDQEQAARAFQSLRHAYLGELQTRGYGSCLADNMAGYDDSDGREQIVRAYRHIEDSLGRVKIACLKLECEKGPECQPFDLGVLRNALDCMGALT